MLACGILAAPLGIKPTPPTLDEQSLNRWTTEKVA